MKMKEYMAPEMEVIKLKYNTSLLSESTGEQTTPDEPIVVPPGTDL